MLVVDVYKIKKNMEKQGGAILRNSTGAMDIVWEENRQLAFSVTNWKCWIFCLWKLKYKVVNDLNCYLCGQSTLNISLAEFDNFVCMNSFFEKDDLCQLIAGSIERRSTGSRTRPLGFCNSQPYWLPTFTLATICVGNYVAFSVERHTVIGPGLTSWSWLVFRGSSCQKMPLHVYIRLKLGANDRTY